MSIDQKLTKYILKNEELFALGIIEMARNMRMNDKYKERFRDCNAIILMNYANDIMCI